ncbi:MAG: hypothetical protein V4613_13335 [Bacteroidota bacterium]
MTLRFCKYITVLVLLFNTSCKQNSGSTKSDEVIAEVGNHQLLKKDIPEELLSKLNDAESKSFLKAYVDKWVEKQVMLLEAENTLNDQEKDKEQLIQDYRTSLLIFEYQQKAIKEKMDTGVTDQETETFYNQHPENFLLKKNIVKIRYVKIDKKKADLLKIKQLIQNPNPVNDSLLRLYAEKEASNFYLDNNWLYLDDITKEIPLDENYNQQRFLSNNKFISIDENNILYLLYIIDFRIKDSLSPLEFEKDRIKDIILYQRKLDFLQSIQKGLLEKANKAGQVKINLN